MEERIQKILARMGVASRRKAEELIAEGRVVVNGRTAVLGMKADPERDHIRVDGRPLRRPEPKVYIMLNKPPGVLTTLEDTEGRPTVKQLIGSLRFRVYPVGRLDFNSEGLLLLTNDGELAYRVIHPSHKVPKTYLVKIKGVIGEDDLNRLRRGVMLDDGMTAPARIRRVRMPRAEKNSWLEVTIHEGRKRQIRRMFERVGHAVLKLKRIRIDGLELGGLRPGQWRYLSDDELKRLKRSLMM